jgi:hypothetical protein
VEAQIGQLRGQLLHSEQEKELMRLKLEQERLEREKAQKQVRGGCGCGWAWVCKEFGREGKSMPSAGSMLHCILLTNQQLKVCVGVCGCVVHRWRWLAR